MLGKLMKHEFKATARTFGVMYLCVFIVAVLAKVFVEIQNVFNFDNVIIDILGSITLIAYVLGIFGTVIGTFILILKRFYDNMLKHEGYLSFTLPATVGQHLTSKMIVSYVWILASGAFVCGIIGILFLGHVNLFSSLKDGLFEVIDLFNQQNLWKYVFEFIGVLVIGAYGYIAVGYACFSVGQAWTKNRIAGALVSYIVFKIILEIVSAICMVWIFGGNLEAMENANVGDVFFQPMMIFAIAQQVIIAVVCTVLTHVMLSKKLNLE